MKNLNKTLGLALATWLAVPLAASAAPAVYSLIVLPEEIQGAGIDRAGEIVSPSQPGVLVWSESGIRRLSTLDPVGFSTAAKINDRGDVAGTSFIVENHDTAFVNIGGVVHNVGAAAPDFEKSIANGLNNAGWVVGELLNGRSPGSNSRAFIYRNGNVQVLPTFGGLDGVAVAVSNRGHVTGGATEPTEPGAIQILQGFLYFKGKMTRLGTLPGGQGSVGDDVNDRGEVTGVVNTGTGAKGFVYSHGKMTDIGTVGGRLLTFPKAINNVGVVVGQSTNIESASSRGFIWFNKRIIDLNRLVDPRSGWQVRDARDINDAFQIVAWGCRVDNDSVCRWLRLDPPAGTRKHRIAPFIAELFGTEPDPDEGAD
jgi:probable HAF family extracellular repeat protein